MSLVTQFIQKYNQYVSLFLVLLKAKHFIQEAGKNTHKPVEKPFSQDLQRREWEHQPQQSSQYVHQDTQSFLQQQKH